MSQESLKNKTVKGIGWSFADSILGQGITFIVGLVLARVLSPDEYGLIGIITIFIVVFNGIVDSGFSNALIRKQDCTEEDYNTMFFVNLAMSIFLFIILFFCAPFISHFFKRPELTSLTRVMGLMMIFNALSLVQVTILTKRIDFKTKTKASLISAIISGIVGIGMAYAGCGVWSLVGQQLSRQFLYSLCLWILNRWWPRFILNWNSFRYMWGFGWKLLVSGLLNNIWNQLYQIVIGRFYSPATLGQYTRSNQFASILSENLTSVVQRVSYPVLSEIQDEKKRLVESYRKLIKITMFVTFVGMFALGAVAEPLIYCLIGPQWSEAASYLPIICIYLSLYPLNAINLNMLQVQGRSDVFLYLEIIKKILAIGPICMGIFVNIYWMLYASIVFGFFAFFLNSWYSGKSLGYSSLEQLKDIAPSCAVAIVVAISVFFLKYLPFSNWIILPLQMILGSFVFFFTCRVANIYEYEEIKRVVITLIKHNNQTKNDELY